jgi:hypothetical protein
MRPGPSPASDPRYESGFLDPHVATHLLLGDRALEVLADGSVVEDLAPLASEFPGVLQRLLRRVGRLPGEENAPRSDHVGQYRTPAG